MTGDEALQAYSPLPEGKKTKMKKPTLRETFEDFFVTYPTINGCPPDSDCIWNFFAQHLKKTTSKPKLTIDIPLDRVKEFNELWPKEKLDTGKHGRCSQSELVSAFTWFFKVHPDFTDWNILMQAAMRYTQEREQDNWNYTKRSKYFVRKQLSDKSFTSELSEYYERIRDGVQDEQEQQRGNFEPKVY